MPHPSYQGLRGVVDFGRDCLCGLPPGPSRGRRATRVWRASPVHRLCHAIAPQENWGDLFQQKGVRYELLKGHEGTFVESALVTLLGEVLVNFSTDNWARPFQDDLYIKEEGKWLHVFLRGLPGYVSYATALLLVMCVPAVPGFVLATNDVVHYEEQLWSTCFVWMYAVVIAQTLIVFLTAPYLGWGMIKESSRDQDLGVTLKGSMNQQAVVSTLLFSMTMAKLQTGLSSLDMVVDFDQTASTSEQYAGFALAQWYAVSYCSIVR